MKVSMKSMSPTLCLLGNDHAGDCGRSESLNEMRNVTGFDSFSPGVYFIRISGENSVMTKKIVKR